MATSAYIQSRRESTQTPSTMRLKRTLTASSSSSLRRWTESYAGSSESTGTEAAMRQSGSGCSSDQTETSRYIEGACDNYTLALQNVFLSLLRQWRKPG